jgi:hypothetical protein
MSHLHFHRKIEYKILKSTPKAHLIQVNELNDYDIIHYIKQNQVEKYVKPLEIWCPKTWFKKDYEGQYKYIWAKGFYNNLVKLIEKRKKNDDDKME